MHIEQGERHRLLRASSFSILVKIQFSQCILDLAGQTYLKSQIIYVYLKELKVVYDN